MSKFAEDTMKTIDDITTQTFENWTGKDIELTRKEYGQRWIDNAQLNGLSSWRDINGTKDRIDHINDLIQSLAIHIWELKLHDEHIHYGVGGQVDFHTKDGVTLISNGKEVE